MMKNIQTIRGMHDYLPSDTVIWQQIEDILKQVFSSYGYSEIRTPIVERTLLFKRAIGALTDIVEKEMYTFADRNGVNLTLRPEGTAGCVRAGIEHALLYNQEQRLWYIGPMFRYERPQKGRYRQFYQLGAEVFGLQGPYIEAELIMLTTRWCCALGIAEYISLEINSIGSLETRDNYRNALIKFFEQHQKKLDDDCKRRIYSNPLRVLDSKNPQIQTLLHDAPRIGDYLDDESREHFISLCKLLEVSGINYTINQRLVRGLDYYNRTVFEWITDHLGAQKAICAGGRYDSLVEQLGGHPTPAVGLAVGLERLVSLVLNTNPEFKTKFTIDVYLIVLSIKMQSTVMLLAERIRDTFPKIKLMTNYDESNLKKQFSYVEKFGAYIAIVFGKLGMNNNNVIIKDLRTGNQKIIMQNDILHELHSLLD